MKMMWIGLAPAAFASAAAAQPGTPVAPAASAAELAGMIAAEAQRRTPLDMGPGGTLIAARSDGNTLIWVIRLPVALYDEAVTDGATAGMNFREGLCMTDARSLFDSGVALRVDVTDGRRDSVSLPLIADCPASQ